MATGASDASADVLPDAMLDGPQAHSGADVEKLVDPALDVPAQVEPKLLTGQLAPQPAEVLCKPDAALSAA